MLSGKSVLKPNLGGVNVNHFIRYHIKTPKARISNTKTDKGFSFNQRSHMAEEAAIEVNETNEAIEDMDLEAGGDENAESKAKRSREEEEEGDGNGDVLKKQKLDENEKSMEEERLEKKLGGTEENNGSGLVTLGPKVFRSSVEMFDYFYKILHFWPPNLNVNKV